jgi:multidrug resistance efflux pump
VLAEIVDDDYRAAVDQLTAGVAAAAAQIEALKAQHTLQGACTPQPSELTNF